MGLDVSGFGSAVGADSADELIHREFDGVRARLDVDTCVLLLMERGGEHLVAYAASGLEEEVRQGTRVPVGQGFAGRIAADLQPLVITHVEPGVVVNPLLWHKGLRTMLGVPLVIDGRPTGVLHVGSRSDRTFSHDDVVELQAVATRIATVINARSAAEDQRVARAMQRDFLPDRVPAVPGLHAASRFVPTERSGVGGDWYDLFRLPSGDIGVVVGDVAGHGLDAAIVMGRMRSTLRAYAIEHVDPGVVLGHLNTKFSHFEPQAMATVVYAVLSAGLGRVTIANAGHPPPVRRAPDGASDLLGFATEPPICPNFPGARSTRSFELAAGTVLAFYTDGLIERRGVPIDSRFGLLLGAVRGDDPETIAANVMLDLVGNDSVADDIALLVLQLDATR